VGGIEVEEGEWVKPGDVGSGTMAEKGKRGGGREWRWRGKGGM